MFNVVDGKPEESNHWSPFDMDKLINKKEQESKKSSDNKKQQVGSYKQAWDTPTKWLDEVKQEEEEEDVLSFELWPYSEPEI